MTVFPACPATPVRQAWPNRLVDAGSVMLGLLCPHAYSELHVHSGVRWTSNSAPKRFPFALGASGFGVTIGCPRTSKLSVVAVPMSSALSHIKRISTHFLGSGASQLAPMIRWWKLMPEPPPAAKSFVLMK